MNWYINQNVKVVLNYEQNSFDGGGQINAAGAASGAFTNVSDRPNEKTLFSRLQLAY